MSLKTTEEELLGAYSTKQLAMYLRFNNFIELAETVERVELRGKHLRNCCRASSTGQEQQRREEEAGVFNVENDERIVLEVCELFGCTAEEAKRMCEELVKDFADVPWDETKNPPEGESGSGRTNWWRRRRRRATSFKTRRPGWRHGRRRFDAGSSAGWLQKSSVSVVVR